MTRWVGWTLAAFLLFTAGCGGLLPSSPAPRFYGLDYQAHPAACSGAVKANLRVWSLSASPPYDREQMVVTGLDRRLNFSSQYRWIARPGELVADKIIRDLAADNVFQGVASTADPLETKLNLGGRIFQFTVEESPGGTARAVLEAEFVLWRQEPRGEVLFKKHYRLEGNAMATPDSERFSEAMSGLVSRLSDQLREDLCVATKDSSFGAGG